MIAQWFRSSALARVVFSAPNIEAREQQQRQDYEIRDVDQCFATGRMPDCNR
jgi:hypothetical protein